jgi:hypothetical protein
MQSLVMTSPILCMVCNVQDKDCNEIGVSSLYGCIYCPSCLESGKLKKAILFNIEEMNIIPCVWMDDQKLISFFRFSQNKIEDGKLQIFCNYKLIVPFEDDLCIPLCFGENYGLNRSVSISNIIKHCDWFYHELINCTNIFGKDQRVVISYQDLPESFKSRVEYCRKKAFDPLTIFVK